MAAPDVPVAPGVPPVEQSIYSVVDKIEILAADAAIVVRMFLPSGWLIQDQSTNAPALTSISSVLTIEVRADATVATAPQEGGAFVSYNKVQTPLLVRMTVGIDGGNIQPFSIPGIGAQNLGPFAIGDPIENRRKFMDEIEGLRTAASKLTVVTPEHSWKNMTVMHYDWRRTAINGATLLSADIWLQEVREAATAAYSVDTVGNPASADPIDLGESSLFQMQVAQTPDVTAGPPLAPPPPTAPSFSDITAPPP